MPIPLRRGPIPGDSVIPSSAGTPRGVGWFWKIPRRPPPPLEEQADFPKVPPRRSRRHSGEGRKGGSRPRPSPRTAPRSLRKREAPAEVGLSPLGGEMGHHPKKNEAPLSGPRSQRTRYPRKEARQVAATRQKSAMSGARFGPTRDLSPTRSCEPSRGCSLTTLGNILRRHKGLRAQS